MVNVMKQYSGVSKEYSEGYAAYSHGAQATNPYDRTKNDELLKSIRWDTGYMDASEKIKEGVIEDCE